MPDSLLPITQKFKGSFIIQPLDIKQKLEKIKAFVFDWDGVFNNGQKDEHGSSPFSEIDAMGTNLLRFNHYLRAGTQPFTAIISGEKNKAAFSFAKREYFNAVYCGFKNKTEALHHLCNAYNINPDEVAFVFDDVLDFKMAVVCGLRILVSRSCNPLLIDFVVRRRLADYITSNNGSNGALREAVELLMGISERYDETVEQRMNNTEIYKQFLKERNGLQSNFFVSHNSKIIEEQES